MSFWWLFNSTLLAAGAASVAFSVRWRRPNLLLNMILDTMKLNLGGALGVLFLLTWAFSIAAVVQRNHITIGLVILNWVLLVDMVYTLVLGTSIWFSTLTLLDTFHQVYSEQTPDARIAIQDMFNCCGYFNSTDLLELGGTACPDTTTAFETQFCWTAITGAADRTLNPVFSTIYGFMAILGCLFLTSLCLINERKKEERFKKIDAKRGGKGFV